MSEDSAVKSLDVDSTFRNRNNYPNPYDFVIPYSFPNKGSTALGFFDPVLDSSPYTGSPFLQPGELVTEGTFLPMTSSTTTDIVLDAQDSPIDNFYINSSLQIGIQFRTIIAYNGFTKVCTVSVPFSVAPPPGTVYYTRKDKVYFNSDVAVYRVNNILKTVDQLNLLTASPSPIKNFYTGSYVRFTNGTHVGETALITKYDPLGITDTWNQETTSGSNSFLSSSDGGMVFTTDTTGILETITLNLTSFESVDPGRTLRVKIYYGVGFNGSILYTNDFIVSNNLTPIDYDLLVTGGPVLSTKTFYTLSISDVTSGGASTGFINIFGIPSGGIYRTFNLNTYPEMSISVINGSDNPTWTQSSDTGMNNYIDTFNECGFRIVPSNTGVITVLTLSMISFETVSPGRTVTLKIRDGSGLSGTILFQNDYLLSNTALSATDVSINIVGGPSLTIGNNYTVTLIDITPGNFSTGYINLFGIVPNGTYISYNSSVYPRLNVNNDSYNLRNILKASSIPGSIAQGTSVSLSNDGSILVTGAYQGTASGRTLVWTRSGSTWIFVTSLVGTGTSPPQTFQGISVAISSDGSTIATGGPIDNSNVGAVWIFTLISGVWVQQGSKLIGSGSIIAKQGSSVALSSDGNTLAIGGPEDNSLNGAVWIFTRSGGIWTQEAGPIYDNLHPGVKQGYSVALSSDGNTLCYGSNSSGLTGGWIWTRSGGIWTQQTFLSNTNKTLGYSCSLSADGNTCALGAISDQQTLITTGAVYIYTRSGGIWSQESRLVGTPTIIGQQGFSCSLSSDGNIIIVGTPTSGGVNLGCSYIFKRNGGIWSQFSKLIPVGNTGNSKFGFSTNVSGDGSYIAVGGPDDALTVGGVWIYTSTPIYSQLSNPVISSVVSLSTEQGFKFIPTTSGVVSTFFVELSSFESLSPGRNVEIKIRNGGGVGGSIIYSGTSIIPISSRGNYLITIGGGVLSSGNTYTITVKDVTSGGYSTGNLFLYGITPTLTYVSYNIAVYPLMTISVSNASIVFSQIDNPTISSDISTIADNGFIFSPFFSGGVSRIMLSLSSFGVLGYRTLNLKILSGYGLGGSVVYSTTVNIGNSLSRTDYTFGLVSPTTLMTGSEYTLVLRDITSGGTGTGNITIYGITNGYPYVSYNTSVYPRINFKISSYVITISPPKSVDGFLNIPVGLLAGTDDNIEFNSQAHDNATTLFQNGVQAHNAQYYKIGLKYVIIPNQVLSVGRGGTLDNYPYILVQIYNDGDRGALNVMISDNPNSAFAVFKCPIDRYLYSRPTSFYTLKTPNKDQIVKFRPDQNIRVTFTLPDGTIIATQLADNMSPLFPNPVLQVNALFTLLPIDKNDYMRR